MVSRLDYYYRYLTADPAGFLVYVLYLGATVLISLILHEVSHGYIALRCGDPTAKMLGRLSLDPRKHLDPIGTVSMLVFGIGWARPVPVNPRNFRNGRKDDLLVSVAGICTNLTLFIICALCSVIINRFLWPDWFLETFARQYGSLQGLLNLYSRGEASAFASLIAYGDRAGMAYLQEYASLPWLLYVQRFLLMMAQINLNLAVFNLIPIPPLDGWHLLNDTILKGRLFMNPQVFRFVQIGLILLCLSGALSSVLMTVNGALYSAVINLFLMILG